MYYLDENNEWQEIVLEPSGDTLPIGSIAQYGGSTAPANWLICNGQAVSRETYSELFAVIGTTYGNGDGSTTFNVPDFSLRVPFGIGSGTDTAGHVYNTSLGQTYGEYEHTLTTDEMPSHEHKLPQNGAFAVSSDGSSTTGITFGPKYGNSNLKSESVGGGQPHNNVPPVLGVNFIIKAKQSIGVMGAITEDITSEASDAVPTCETVKDYVDNAEIYSETEVKTNKVWIDGKPIYRKVVNTGKLQSTTKNVAHNVSNMDLCCSVRGISIQNHVTYHLPRTTSASLNSQIDLYCSRTDITLECGNNANFNSSYVIIEYTKTTD